MIDLPPQPTPPEPTGAETPRAAEVRVARVTLFEDRAEVVRVARSTVAAGTSRLAVPGVALVVDDGSVGARVTAGDARVAATRVVRSVRSVPAADRAEVEAAEEDLRAAHRRREEAELALARAQARQARCGRLADAWGAGVRRVPQGGPEGIARWRAAWTALGADASAALDDALARSAELDAARLDEARAERRHAEARRGQPRHEAAIEVQLVAAATGVVELELVYRVPCALWRPEHVARLVEGAGGAELVLATEAVAWQRTGEEWRDVPLRFSTARPGRVAAPPLLEDDVVALRRRIDKGVTVEARDEVIARAGLERGVRRVDEMPGVDDGGEPLWLEATAPASLPSDGHPVRVPVGEVRVPCRVERVCAPERTPAAHVRVTATLAGGRPLLAGPVRLARGASLVGRGRLPFVAAGEPFELGLGVDDAVRVRRAVEEKRDVAALTGTQRVARKVTLYVANLGAHPRQVVLLERVPVSELEDVAVKDVAARGGERDADGFVRFVVDLPPRGTATRELTYRIEAASRVRLEL